MSWDRQRLTVKAAARHVEDELHLFDSVERTSPGTTVIAGLMSGPWTVQQAAQPVDCWSLGGAKTSSSSPRDGPNIRFLRPDL